MFYWRHKERPVKHIPCSDGLRYRWIEFVASVFCLGVKCLPAFFFWLFCFYFAAWVAAFFLGPIEPLSLRPSINCQLLMQIECCFHKQHPNTCETSLISAPGSGWQKAEALPNQVEHLSHRLNISISLAARRSQLAARTVRSFFYLWLLNYVSVLCSRCRCRCRPGQARLWLMIWPGTLPQKKQRKWGVNRRNWAH